MSAPAVAVVLLVLALVFALASVFDRSDVADVRDDADWTTAFYGLLYPPPASDWRHAPAGPTAWLPMSRCPHLPSDAGSLNCEEHPTAPRGPDCALEVGG